MVDPVGLNPVDSMETPFLTVYCDLVLSYYSKETLPLLLVNKDYLRSSIVVSFLFLTFFFWIRIKFNFLLHFRATCSPQWPQHSNSVKLVLVLCYLQFPFENSVSATDKPAQRASDIS